MTRYLKDDSGKFAGSIGDGATNVPTAAPDLAMSPVDALNDAVAGQGIDQAYASFTRRRLNPFVPEFADPETTASVLERLDKIGLRATRKLEDWRDREESIRGSKSMLYSPYQKRALLEAVQGDQEALHGAVMEARERLEAAAAIMEDRETKQIDPSYTFVLDADELSYASTHLADFFDEPELQHDWDRGDKEVMDKVSKASAQILLAKRAMNTALTPDKRTSDTDED